MRIFQVVDSGVGLINACVDRGSSTPSMTSRGFSTVKRWKGSMSWKWWAIVADTTFSGAGRVSPRTFHTHEFLSSLPGSLWRVSVRIRFCIVFASRTGIFSISRMIDHSSPFATPSSLFFLLFFFFSLVISLYFLIYQANRLKKLVAEGTSLSYWLHWPRHFVIPNLYWDYWFRILLWNQLCLLLLGLTSVGILHSNR